MTHPLAKKAKIGYSNLAYVQARGLGYSPQILGELLKAESNYRSSPHQGGLDSTFRFTTVEQFIEYPYDEPESEPVMWWFNKELARYLSLLDSLECSLKNSEILIVNKPGVRRYDRAIESLADAGVISSEYQTVSGLGQALGRGELPIVNFPDATEIKVVTRNPSSLIRSVDLFRKQLCLIAGLPERWFFGFEVNGNFTTQEMEATLAPGVNELVQRWVYFMEVNQLANRDLS